jgi:hypothetical protein
MNSLFMVVGALGAASMLGAGLSIPHLFLLAAIVNACVAIALFRIEPAFMQRLMIRVRDRTRR